MSCLSLVLVVVLVLSLVLAVVLGIVIVVVAFSLFSYTRGRLTWNMKMELWKITFLYNPVVLRFYDNLPGCIIICVPSSDSCAIILPLPFSVLGHDHLFISVYFLYRSIYFSYLFPFHPHQARSAGGVQRAQHRRLHGGLDHRGPRVLALRGRDDMAPYSHKTWRRRVK